MTNMWHRSKMIRNWKKYSKMWLKSNLNWRKQSRMREKIFLGVRMCIHFTRKNHYQNLISNKSKPKMINIEIHFRWIQSLLFSILISRRNRKRIHSNKFQNQRMRILLISQMTMFSTRRRRNILKKWPMSRNPPKRASHPDQCLKSLSQKKWLDLS